MALMECVILKFIILLIIIQTPTIGCFTKAIPEALDELELSWT
jgi:hypothetical protein